MSAIRIDFAKHSLPTHIKAMIKEQMPDLPRAVLRGIQAASSVIFTGDDAEDHDLTLESIQETLDTAHKAAEQYYEHNNGEIPEEVLTVLPGGHEMIFSSDYHDLFTGKAHELLQEISAVQDDPSLLLENKLSPNGWFVLSVLTHEHVKDTYRAMLLGLIDDITATGEENEFKTWKSLLDADENILDEEICNQIERLMLLKNNIGKPSHWYLSITAHQDLEDMSVRQLAEVAGLSNTPVVAKALEIAFLYDSGRTLEDFQDGEALVNDCGPYNIEDLADFCDRIIGPVRQLKALYPDISPERQAAFILYPYLYTPEGPKFINHDFAELVSGAMLQEGEDIIHLYNAGHNTAAYSALDIADKKYLHDYNGICLMGDASMYVSHLLNLNAGDTSIYGYLDALESIKEELDDIIANNYIYSEALRTEIYRMFAAMSDIQMIAETDNDLDPQALDLGYPIKFPFPLPTDEGAQDADLAPTQAETKWDTPTVDNDNVVPLF